MGEFGGREVFWKGRKRKVLGDYVGNEPVVGVGGAENFLQVG
jgi:hypothetical protein